MTDSVLVEADDNGKAVDEGRVKIASLFSKEKESLSYHERERRLGGGDSGRLKEWAKRW